MAKPQPWPIFICYRHVDGSAAARRLHELLDKWTTEGPENQPIQLDVYLAETMPGVGNWKELHRPYLEKARALIVICTPGAKLREGPDDWVHLEIDWWLAHRDVAPILIDPLMAGLRYVPSEIVERWPEIQRIVLVEKEWNGLTKEAQEEKAAEVRRKVLGAIVPSGAAIYVQELEEERRRAKWLRRALTVSIVLLIAAVLLGGYAFLNERIANASRLDARAAGQFARSRLMDARRELERIRRSDIEEAIAADDAPNTRRKNLQHELDQIAADIDLLRAEESAALAEGCEALKRADTAWQMLGAVGDLFAKKRIRPEPPYILSVELINAGGGESILVHYGTPDDIRLVMINGGPTGAFKDLVEPRLQQIKRNGFGNTPIPLELFVVGDRDEHKTGGLLKLLEDQNPSSPPVHIRGIWANIFRVDGAAPNLRSQIRKLVDDLKLPLNEPFDHLVLRPEKGRAAVTLLGGLEIVVLGPDRHSVTELYELEKSHADRWGGAIEALPSESFSKPEIAIEPVPLSLPSSADSPGRDCAPSENARNLAGGTYTDRSIPNLASTVMLFRYREKAFLYTGDARGDRILEGLAAAGLLDPEGRINVDLLSIPHLGSDRNVTVDFFKRVRASHYLFSGDGTHGNPEIPTVAALIDARGCDVFRMYFVNRDGEKDEHGRKLDSFFQAEQRYKPNYRRIFRLSKSGSIIINLGDPIRY